VLNIFNSVFCYPDFVRFSWGPAKDAIKEHGVPIEWEADLEEEEDDVRQPKLNAFIKVKKRARTSYFVKQKLTVVPSILT